MFIYPYKAGSNSVRNLKQGLGAKAIKLEGSNFSGALNKIVINWGNSTPNSEVDKCLVMNNPENIARVSNKLSFFEHVKDKCRIPSFTTDKSVASVWLETGKTVVVREKLTGHSGEGIVIIEDQTDWNNYNHNNAKMYVLYVPKKQEYRIHIVGDNVVLVQRKAKRHDVHPDMVNYKVRNHSNGFVFVKNEDHTPPDDVIEQAKLAIDASDLDFGAVDVVWNEYRQEATVLEINSAPGLEGTTVDTYIEALKAYISMVEGLEEEKKKKAKTKRKAFYSGLTLDEMVSAIPEPVYLDESEPSEEF